MCRSGVARSSRAMATAASAGACWAAAHLFFRLRRPWAPGGGGFMKSGALAVRRLGTGNRSIVLLHGLVSSGDVFGIRFDRLAGHARLVVPDILGFGGSMDASGPFGLEHHLAALDQMAGDLDLGPTTVVGHSMGAHLALHWAARNSNVDRVVALSAPLYPDRDVADSLVRRFGPIGQLFALDRRIAADTCHQMCAHRQAAKVLAVALSPQLPVRLASRTMDHTWPAYEAVLDDLILTGSWQHALGELLDRGVSVTLGYGRRDRVVCVASYERLAGTHPSLEVVSHATAGHHLPLDEPDWSVALALGQQRL